mmetsp:Transcript_6269/g.10475  ORF Transcript_6269/g.10475 Transcript_6269/m.10475 type:complete len:275 (+) Transcript_6269:465-1289(+)
MNFSLPSSSSLAPFWKPTAFSRLVAPSNGATFDLKALLSVLIDLYFGSSGFSARFLTNKCSNFSALPPSPPVRYRMTVWMALSTRCARTAGSVVSATGTAGAEEEEEEEDAFFATGAGAGVAAAPAEPDEEEALSAAGGGAAPSATGWSYCMMEGLYPSTPSTEGSTPLFFLRISLSRAISARKRCRSFAASSFSRFIRSASLLRCSRWRSSCVCSIFCPRSRRSFSRRISSAFSCLTRSALRWAIFSRMAAVRAAFSSSDRGGLGMVSALRTR